MLIPEQFLSQFSYMALINLTERYREAVDASLVWGKGGAVKFNLECSIRNNHLYCPCA
jgi:hypothetical protein